MYTNSIQNHFSINDISNILLSRWLASRLSRTLLSTPLSEIRSLFHKETVITWRENNAFLSPHLKIKQKLGGYEERGKRKTLSFYRIFCRARERFRLREIVPGFTRYLRFDNRICQSSKVSLEFDSSNLMKRKKKSIGWYFLEWFLPSSHIISLLLSLFLSFFFFWLFWWENELKVQAILDSGCIVFYLQISGSSPFLPPRPDPPSDNKFYCNCSYCFDFLCCVGLMGQHSYRCV